MTNEEKSILLKDLCARLPYRVRCKCINGLGGGETDHGVLKFIGNCNGVISNYYEDIPIDSGFVNNVFYPIENIKPYLRPISSMTEEEHNDFENRSHGWFYVNEDGEIYPIGRFTDSGEFEDGILAGIEYLIKNHFDYRGLIPMGLALEAPKNMYKI